MTKRFKVVGTIISFGLLILLVVSGYNLQNSKEEKFKTEGQKIIGYAETTIDRVTKAVVTLPETNELVGLDKTKEVEIQKEFLHTSFISGIYEKREPRLDAIVPMYVYKDSHNGSTYIVLFQDRGDVALEKSYARIGSLAAKIESIETLPADPNVAGEEYRVHVVYKMVGISGSPDNIVSRQKDLIIPVIDGHFDPKGTISK